MKTYLSVIFILISCITIAQNKQYIQVKGHLGSSGLVYPLDNASQTGGFGAGGSLSYHYFFNNNWGVGLGFGMSNVKTTTTLGYHTTVTNGYTDDEGDVYDSHLYLYNWEEVQKSRLFEIPLTVSYQRELPCVEGLNLYADAGFTFQLPSKSTYEVTQGVFENQGYYSKWNITLSEIPGHFEKSDTYLPQGDVDLKPCVSAIANIGLSYAINAQIECFAGLNMGYSFGNMKDGGESQLVTMSEDLAKSYNGLINSTEVSQVKTRRIGLEVGVRFSLFNKNNEAKFQEALAADQEYADTITNAIEQAHQDSIYQAQQLDTEKHKQTLLADSIRQQKPDARAIIPTDAQMQSQESDVIVTLFLKNKDFPINGDQQVDENTLFHVYFEHCKKDLDSGVATQLSEIFTYINEHPGTDIIIEGHASEDGPENVNLEYGAIRAENTAVLIKQHCPTIGSIETVSYGESKLWRK